MLWDIQPPQLPPMGSFHKFRKPSLRGRVGRGLGRGWPGFSRKARCGSSGWRPYAFVRRRGSSTSGLAGRRRRSRCRPRGSGRGRHSVLRRVPAAVGFHTPRAGPYRGHRCGRRAGSHASGRDSRPSWMLFAASGRFSTRRPVTWFAIGVLFSKYFLVCD